MEATSECRRKPSPNVYARRFDEEMIVLDLERGRYFQLDEVGAAIWEGLEQGRNLREIASVLAGIYDAPPERLLADAAALVGQLEEAGLMTVESRP